MSAMCCIVAGLKYIQQILNEYKPTKAFPHPLSVWNLFIFISCWLVGHRMKAQGTTTLVNAALFNHRKFSI